MRARIWFHVSMDLGEIANAGEVDAHIQSLHQDLTDQLDLTVDDMGVIVEDPRSRCYYCEGTCPTNEPEFVCDGFAGDIDRVYQVEEIG